MGMNEEQLWSEECPTAPGNYEMQCGEGDFKTEHRIVRLVFGRKGLWVKDPDVGDNPIDHYHHGLTGTRWRKMP